MSRWFASLVIFSASACAGACADRELDGQPQPLQPQEVTCVGNQPDQVLPPVVGSGETWTLDGSVIVDGDVRLSMGWQGNGEVRIDVTSSLDPTPDGFSALTPIYEFELLHSGAEANVDVFLLMIPPPDIVGDCVTSRYEEVDGAWIEQADALRLESPGTSLRRTFLGRASAG